MKTPKLTPKLTQILVLGFAALLILSAGLIFWLSTRPAGQQNLGSILEPADNKSQAVIPEEQITLTYWRTWDGAGPIEQIAADYKKLHPNVTIEVRDIDYGAYDDELAAAARTNTLPDMFTVLNDWIPRYIGNSVPAPATVYSEKTYRDTFVDVATDRLVTNGQINGVSYGVSTLGLFYNTEIFKAANLNPPTNWDEFVDVSRKLTQKNGSTVTRAGAIMGTPFVHQAVDIESLLMMQNGASMTDTPPTKALFAQPDKAGTAVGAKALDFYTSFARPGKENYSYSDSLGYSVQAFAEGKAAMMLNYPFKSAEVDQFNPQATYKMTKIPQIKGESQINFAQYWAEMVSKESRHSEVAWDFLRFAATKDQQKRFNKTTLRPTSRKDLLNDQKNDDKLGSFVQQTPTARIFYRGNDRDMNGYFYDATISILSGLDPQPATRQAEARATTLIQQTPYK